MVNDVGWRSALRKEPSLAIKPVMSGLGCVTSIALHMTGTGIVGEVLVQDLISEATNQTRRTDWKQHFDAAIKIARHQIGAARVDLLASAIAEVKNPAMFQKAPHNTDHPNVIAHPRNTRP